MKIAKLVFYVLIVLAVALFALAFSESNDGVTTVNYFAGTYTGPLSVALGVVFVLGFILALLIACVHYFFLNMKYRRALRKIEKLQKDFEAKEVKEKVASL